MSVETFFRLPGGLANASSETQLQSLIATETSQLESSHLRTEALNRVHFQSTPSDVTTISNSVNSALGGAAGVYASPTYVPITHGAPLLLDFGASGISIEAGWVVRYQWSLLVEDFERAGNLGEYAFCLKTDTGGAGTFVQQSPDYWYSAMSYPRDGPSTSTYWPKKMMRHTLSYAKISATPYTLYDARVDVKITAPWSITIRQDNLFAIVQRH